MPMPMGLCFVLVILSVACFTSTGTITSSPDASEVILKDIALKPFCLMEMLPLALVLLLSATTSWCTPQFRLVGGPTPFAGRVEVLHDGRWGTVCGDGFNQKAADVVCKLIGFDYATDLVPSAKFGAGSGMIWLDQLRCSSSTLGLASCTHRGWGVENCTHSQDMGLRCVPKFRLANNRNPSYGYIEVLYKNEWGTVCHDSFNQMAGDMICQELGFSHAAALSTNSRLGRGSGRIWVDMFQCSSTAKDLSWCTHRGWGVLVSCNHNEDMGLRCMPKFRLVNGSSPFSGRVEVLYRNQWGTVCRDGFNQNAGDMICKELGFKRASQLHSDTRYGQGEGRIWLDELSCTGSTGQLTTCTHSAWGSHDCDHARDMALECEPELQVRLVNGSVPSSGRIEVFHGDQWGTICDDNFNTNAGHVICKLLGYDSASKSVPSAGFGQGSGRIWLDNFQCSSTTGGFAGCSHRGWGRLASCNHAEDQGLQCTTKFQLSDGPNPSSGRAEVLHRNQWGTICSQTFNQPAGDMICKQLGFKHTSRVHRLPVFGRATGNIWLTNVSCSESSQNLSTCRHDTWGSHNCSHEDDLGLDCMPEFRLVNGTSSLSGRIEVKYKNTWGVVCRDSFNQHAADMICKQLGFQAASHTHTAGRYGRGTGQFWLDNLSCSASDDGLAACTYNAWGDHDCTDDEALGLDCLPKFRLVGGSNSSGRVEVFYNGEWGSICDDSFNQDSGDMICKALGYDYASLLEPNAHYGGGSGPIWLDDLKCNTSNDGLRGCTHNGWGEHNCNHNEDMALTCGWTKFKLVDGPEPSLGRVEVLYRGQWGTVCDTTFSKNAGDMVCKELGFDHASLVALWAEFGQGTGPVWLDELKCSTTHQGLDGCTHRGWGKTNCTHRNDVGLECVYDADMNAQGNETMSSKVNDAGDDVALEVRLVSGWNYTSGRIEVLHDDLWGTVCDDSFNQEAGDMICGILGFRRALQLVPAAFFGHGSGPIWLDDLMCTLTDRGLAGCYHRGWGQHDCHHGEDMGLVCDPGNANSTAGQP